MSIKHSTSRVSPFRAALACLAAAVSLAVWAEPAGAIGTVTNYTGTGISAPFGITAGPDGALWFTNAGNSSIGRITTGGMVSNYSSGLGESFGITAGPDGALWFANDPNSSIGRITTEGVVSNYPNPVQTGPYGITAGPDGALWFANSNKSSIGRITTGGEITNYTGTGILGPLSITAGSDGALWFTNAGNSSIGRITTSGIVSNYTGTGISRPTGIAAGSDGALWFTNEGNNSIGRITTSGVVSNYTGGGISEPFGITAGPDGALWFVNSHNNSIGRITTSGVVSNFTGTGISTPREIAAGSDGALWFTNNGNDSIGRITAGGSPHYYKNSFPSGGLPAKEKVRIVSWGALTLTPESGHGGPTTCEDAAGGYVENREGPEGVASGSGETVGLTAYNCANVEKCPEGEVEIAGKHYPREFTVNAEALAWPTELTEPEPGKVRTESTGVRLSLQCIAHGSKVSASGPGEHEPVVIGTPTVCVTDSTHHQAPLFEKGSNFGPSTSKLTFDANSGALSCEGGAFTAKTSGALKTMGYKTNELIIAK
jgi:virginiamycin B lyase